MDEKKKKAAAAATVAAVISASGAAVETTFDNPADILQNSDGEPKIEYVHAGDDQNTASQDEEKKAPVKPTLKESFREWILNLPLGIRIFFVLPQWFIGSLVIAGGEFLLAGLSPILHGLISFVLMALVIAAAFAVTAKAMFPDLPLGRILNRHSLKWILLVSAAAFAANLILGILWPGYARFKLLVIAGLTLLSLTALLIWFSGRERRRRAKIREEEEEAPAEEPDELVYTSLGQDFTLRPRDKTGGIK